MAKNNNSCEDNKTYMKIVGLLKDANKTIMHPIIVNTSNVDKDAWISCNFTGTGVHIPLEEIDFEDFKTIDHDIMRHYATWTYTDKKKKNNN